MDGMELGRESQEMQPCNINIVYRDAGLELSVCRSHLKAEVSKRFREDSLSSGDFVKRFSSNRMYNH